MQDHRAQNLLVITRIAQAERGEFCFTAADDLDGTHSEELHDFAEFVDGEWLVEVRPHREVDAAVADQLQSRATLAASRVVQEYVVHAAKYGMPCNEARRGVACTLSRNRPGRIFMKPFAVLLAVVCSLSGALLAAEPSKYDPELAKKLGADERGMKMFVLCVLKTGPKDAEVKGEARNKVFEGHFANIGRLADEGKLVVAGPFGKNERSWRGLYIFNVSTVEEAEKLVVLDPAVKAGVFQYELTPWYASAGLMVVTETHKRIEKPKS